MRALIPCLLATAALAGGSLSGRSYESPEEPGPRSPAPRASLEADADQLEIIVRVTVSAPTRAEADARMRTISAKVSTRFDDQEGLELQRLEHTFAHPRPGSSSGSFLSGKSDKEPDSFTAASCWAFRCAIGDDATGSADRLRKLAADLVDPKAVKEENEAIRVGETTFRLSNPEDYRDALLHRIREDAAQAARHLPDGENRLELPSLEERVRFAPLTSTHFVLWLPYTLKHRSQVTADDGHCGCEDGEPTEEPEKEGDSK